MAVATTSAIITTAGTHSLRQLTGVTKGRNCIRGSSSTLLSSCSSCPAFAGTSSTVSSSSHSWAAAATTSLGGGVRGYLSREDHFRVSGRRRGTGFARKDRGVVRAEIFIEEAETEGVQKVAGGDNMTIPKTQKAWTYKEFGPKENLTLSEVDVKQDLAADDVLVKVKAAALNPIDYKRRSGYLKDTDSPLPIVPGYDAAGVVVKVGSGVSKFKEGDRVYGDVSELPLSPNQYGALAQYVSVKEKLLAVIPERLSFEEAASLPLAVETAFETFEHVNLKEGQTVLVLGGAGGVGSLAVQLAKHFFKASVVATTASTQKIDFVKSLGADVVIDYKKEQLADHPTKYDVVYDTVGEPERSKVVKEDGIVVTIAGKAEPPAIRFTVTSRGSVLETLSPLIQDGTLKPIIDSTGPYKFDKLVEAFGYLEGGRATGKVVIAPIE